MEATLGQRPRRLSEQECPDLLTPTPSSIDNCSGAFVLTAGGGAGDCLGPKATFDSGELLGFQSDCSFPSAAFFRSDAGSTAFYLMVASNSEIGVRTQGDVTNEADGTNVLVYWRAGVQTEKNQMTAVSSGAGDGSFYLAHGDFCIARDAEDSARWKLASDGSCYAFQATSLDNPVSPPPAPPSAPPSLPPPPSSPSPTPPPTHPLDINECLPFDDSSQTPEYCSCLRVLSGNQCKDKEFILNRTYGSEQGVPGEMAAEDRNSYVYWIDYAANRRICYTNVEENIEQNSQVKAGFFGCHANIYQPDSDHVYTSCQSGVYEHIPLDQVTFCSPPSPASPPPSHHRSGPNPPLLCGVADVGHAELLKRRERLCAADRQQPRHRHHQR